MIQLQEVSVQYRVGRETVQALKGVDLEVHKGEFVALMGPSGSGKTTLVHVIGGLLTPTVGSVIVHGVDLRSLPEERLSAFRNRSIGFIFQLFHLQPDETAVQNVELPLIIAGVPPGERRERALSALRSVELADRADHLPQQLSGGEMQRVAVARALVTHPAVLLADEPTGNLDRRATESVMELLSRLRTDLNVTIVLVTHNPRLVEQTDRVISIRDGVVP